MVAINKKTDIEQRMIIAAERQRRAIVLDCLDKYCKPQPEPDEATPLAMAYVARDELLDKNPAVTLAAINLLIDILKAE